MADDVQSVGTRPAPLASMSFPPPPLAKHEPEPPRALDVKDALGYLDAVKRQYVDRPDVYNQFLDIMKDFKGGTIDTPGVIERVSHLFSGNAALIQGFNTFLPAGYRIDSTSGGDAITVTTPAGTITKSTVPGVDYPPVAGAGPLDPNGIVGNADMTNAIHYINKVKNRFINDPDTYKQFLEILQNYQKSGKPQDVTVYTQVQQLFRKAPDLMPEFREFLPNVLDHDSIPIRRKLENGSSTSKRKRAVAAPPPKASPSKAKRSRAQPVTTSPSVPVNQPTSPPPQPEQMTEQEFLAAVKRTLESKEAYDLFHKVMNLYTKDIIDTRTLVTRMAEMLPANLVTALEGILNWTDNVPAPPPSHFHYTSNIRYGMSYRRLPASEMRLSCSGRDSLAHSVLNDEWVTHPIWASEDATFLTHKKNQYEELIHKSEEERYEYQILLEALSRTIALLEPILTRLEEMSNDERMLFKLGENLGGSSKAIYQKVIKKVYGNQHAAEVIQALQESPAVAVPVVLARLKTKDVEWRKERARVNQEFWTPLEAVNFQKSLDHQGSNFKVLDKRNTSNKGLIAQLEQAPDQRLEFEVKDLSIMQDTLRMVFNYLDRPGANEDRIGIERFLRSFVKVFMGADDSFDSALGDMPESTDKEPDETDANAIDEAAELEALRDITPGLPSSDCWFLEPDGSTPPEPEDKSTLRHGAFYANTAFYVLLRLLHLQYSRLLIIKRTSVRAIKDIVDPNPIAVELGLVDLAATREANACVRNGYEQMFDAVTRVLSGDIEQPAYEDYLRTRFGIHAYHLFTVERVIPGIVKAAQTILTDHKSLSLLYYLKIHRSLTEPKMEDQVRYRRKAEALIGNDDVYRAEWIEAERRFIIKVLETEDSTFNHAASHDSETIWTAYAVSYKLTYQTEEVPNSESETRNPFLRRNMTRYLAEDEESATPLFIGDANLRARISERTGKIHYVANSEDMHVRTVRQAENPSRTEERRRRGRQELEAFVTRWHNARTS